MKIFELIKEQEATGKILYLTKVNTPLGPFTELVKDVKIVVMPPEVVDLK
jgi:hypothetical protein